MDARQYIKNALTWNRLYRSLSYLRSALWFVPVIAIVLVMAVTPFVRALDSALGWTLLGLDADGAEALYQTVVTLTLSFLVFTFGSLLVAIQVAGGQLTPRIIATILLSNKVVRYSVGLFVFALVFSVSAMNRQQGAAHQLIVFIAAALGIACMAVFLFLIDYAARLLRPVSIVANVGDDALAVIDAVYPVRSEHPDEAVPTASRELGRVRNTVSHEGASGIVLAVALQALVAEARHDDCVIELVPKVGDFIAYGEPLFVVYGGTAAPEEQALRAMVAVGAERTLEQDPMFGFRILVDIAIKALSPAINDPTTAVVAIDQIHRLLRELGKRELRREEVVDQSGRLRVIFRTPNWEDFVHLACNEIRLCGAGNVQVARR
ncbi:MAG TPA: DUF2254 domain-containing protein, partial [Burkholderiales bacterium]|nr:DUF2254 domain-containing protein [Burkholderiales bacterium]